jgi:hypothetical protein
VAWSVHVTNHSWELFAWARTQKIEVTDAESGRQLIDLAAKRHCELLQNGSGWVFDYPSRSSQ